jgi:hypothetical protein
MAEFRARQAAVRMLVNDCGVAHKNTMFGKAKVYHDEIAWVATSTAYISMDDCNKARKGSAGQESQALAKDQDLYTQMLTPTHGVDEDELTADRAERQKMAADQKVLSEKIQRQMAAQQAKEWQNQQTADAVKELQRRPAQIVKVVNVSPLKSDCMRQYRDLISQDQRLELDSPEHYALINRISAKEAECRKL